MNITSFHAKYFAYELTKRSASDSIEKLTYSLFDAQVDLNPHQVEAALFAFKSPLSKGAVLADEVGLGKSIEAGLVISQKWAERKRKILIIVPASLRKQWNQELSEKFFIPSTILESPLFKKFEKDGVANPFKRDDIIICSYHFARSKEKYIKRILWDLVVIDEAHRLRNIYKPTNKIANAIKKAVDHAPKLLLTATPLQNTLLELYGLVSVIDNYAFGDLRSFKSQFSRLTSDDNFNDLKKRLSLVCKRTLRRQVLEYIKYTNRTAITQEFIPSESEQQLYNLVSAYLQRPILYALPASQRHLMTLILRKLLASSTYAISGTLASLANKLECILENKTAKEDIEDLISDNLESYPEIKDELEVEDSDDENDDHLTKEDIQLIKQEIEELRSYHRLAESIKKNAKGKVLLTALKKGFEETERLGGNRKAIIFTESRRTQLYLKELLERSEYGGGVITFNGTNNDEESREIYNYWLQKYEGTDWIAGSKSTNQRTAIVDYFQHNAIIMIATEAAAEGINLQFCSLVVNYDLPWNPQRIEQRIGRCHRYGQKYDVVVVNFLNIKNAADQRVYELLDQKFKLFNGVFGASDEILGSIESGVDFEKRIAEIYQNCRTPEEIQLSFDFLQTELEEQINDRMKNTRQKLLENFDEEVHEKLRVNLMKSREYLNLFEERLWQITRFILEPYAQFDGEMYSFKLKKNPFPEVKIYTGHYQMGKDVNEANIYRIGHPLAQHIIEQCKMSNLDFQTLRFDYSNSPKKITILESLVGKSGWLRFVNVTISALESEDIIIPVGYIENGNVLDEEQCRRFFSLPAVEVNDKERLEKSISDKLKEAARNRQEEILKKISEKNAEFFEEEMDKLDKWAEDKRNSLKLNLKELDEEIKELKRNARKANNLPDKLAAQKKARILEKKRDDAWHAYDQAGREIENQKDELIDRIEKKLKQKISINELFTIRWELV